MTDPARGQTITSSRIRYFAQSASGCPHLVHTKGIHMKTSKTFRRITSAVIVATSWLVSSTASAQAPAPGPAKTAVLVHGAFADGTSWQRVIPLLRKAGLQVIAVQNPLDALENDVAFTNRALDLAEGPVVLVGHPWGGVVITEAGLHEKVRSLVYVAAFVPDVGQSLVDTKKDYPDPPGQAFIVKDSQGFLKFSEEGVFNYFAADLPRSEQEIVAATQGTFSSTAIRQPVSTASWRRRPSFVVVTTN